MVKLVVNSYNQLADELLVEFNYKFEETKSGELSSNQFKIPDEEAINALFESIPTGASELAIHAWMSQKPITMRELRKWWAKINQTDPMI